MDNDLRSVFFLLFFTVISLLPVSSLPAEETEPSHSPGSLVTIWPLVDYRENRATQSTKLSILGPILSFDKTPEDGITAFRPLFHSAEDSKQTRNFTYYLYPLASSEKTPDVSRVEFLEIFQKNTFRKAEPEEKEQNSMLFPLYISGDSKQYGPYTSVFPIYGDIYERFWRDEYHYVLFPLYGRTVNKGTTNYNVLWPFFSITSGEKESGFRFWPIYGQSAKEGRYKNRFALWPIYSQEEKISESGELSKRFSLFPLYASFDSPSVTSRTWLWPFFGYSTDTAKGEEERDYLWPFWLTVSGKKRNVTRFLPFYADERTEDSTRNWYIWPIYRNDTLWSANYRQERDRVLFFLYTKKLETWPADKKERTRTALWPLFLMTSNTSGENSLTMPALLEPILDKEGIERLWAPLWRVYAQTWSDTGDSSLSLFWNLYWHEKSGKSMAWELFPVYRQREAPSYFDMQILKGLVNYTEDGSNRSLALFWLPFGFNWKSGENSQQ
jgi:hypothetical protein